MALAITFSSDAVSSCVTWILELTIFAFAVSVVSKLESAAAASLIVIILLFLSTAVTLRSAKPG